MAAEKEQIVLDTSEIEARRAGITKGEWIVARNPWTWIKVSGRLDDGRRRTTIVAPEVHGDANAEFIAHAPKDIDDLLAEIARLKRRVLAIRNEVILCRTYDVDRFDEDVCHCKENQNSHDAYRRRSL